MFRRLPWLGVMLMGCALATACGSKQDQPLVASSAQQASYAARYPDALKDAIEEFNKREEEANAVLGEVPNYSTALQDPDWGLVLEITDAAIQSGRSQAFAERMREVRHVRTFFEEEKDEINRRAGGAAQYAAQQGGCNVQVGGSVGAALGKAVDKQLEERLRARNEAQLLIVRNSETLGKANAEKLTQQSDHLAYLSYITRVELTETKRRVEAMIEEAAEVEKTADAFIADEEAFQKTPNRTDDEKQTSVARVKLMKDAKGRVASSAKEAEKTVEQMQQRIEKLQADFDYIVGAYRSELEQKSG